MKGNSGGVRGVRLILTQEFSGRFECRCWQLHTSPGQGTAPGASPRAGNGGKAAQEILNSFSSASAQIPNQALLSEWNEHSKSSFKY